jgi:hypothetical protein
MLTKSSVIKIVAVTALATAGVAARAGDDPRQPNWFWGKARTNSVDSTTERYVDSRNPRAPSFYAKGAWEAVAASEEAYVDRGNPLHPKHTF